MNKDEQTAYGGVLIRQGRSDEDVERLAGLDLIMILELRASSAAAPARLAELQRDAIKSAGEADR
jgi:hypothetical protein